MESALELTTPQAGGALPYSVQRHDSILRRPDTVVLQVDGTLSAIDGFAWLAARRDEAVTQRLAALHRDADADGLDGAGLARERLRVLRPRRAEINELGAAYVASLTPGAVDAARALRRAGVALVLSSDLAAEALFGVATALGVGPDELRAPRLRFDALGAYAGCDLGRSMTGASAPGTVFVGTRRGEHFAPSGADAFVAFTGVVAREGRSDAAATIASLHDLAPLLLR